MDPFISLNKLEAIEAIKGGFLTSVQTENLTVAYTDLKAGVQIPLHHHPEEAIDIVLEGELQMQVGNSVSTLKSGMISIVPSNIPHCAKAITDCKTVSVFYPQRKM